MNKRIIYQANDGGVVILVPTPDCIEQYGIEAIALKDVPSGQPFKIVDISQIPEDRTFRHAWEIDLASLTDGIGSDSNEFLEENQ
jgi:hypothetical protein